MRPPKGFTLAEMAVVTILAGIIFSGLAAVYSTGIKVQLAGLRKTVVQNNALMGTKELQSQLEQATRIDQPTGATANGTIQGGINVDPTDGSIMNPNWPAASPGKKWFFFCVGTGAQCSASPNKCNAPCLLEYTGTLAAAAAWPPAWPACGAAGGLLLAAPLSTTTPFTRPVTNVVAASFNVFRKGSKDCNDNDVNSELRAADITSNVSFMVRTKMPL
ncbi:MAG TPA: type II secretion system protein [Elusimicrobiota bacterium]|jgi:prepilin-type N-terminal cleavage/methylation domain-containing protein|nr:type II secretion system protein [Elusimicrobiota bacterium]